jgi:hypothetical protein
MNTIELAIAIYIANMAYSGTMHLINARQRKKARVAEVAALEEFKTTVQRMIAKQEAENSASEGLN